MRERASGADVTREALTEARRDPDTFAAQLDTVALQAATGDRDALDLLIWSVDHFDLALPAIKRMVINESDVDDVRQNVLITVAEKVSSFRGEARFTTWLSQVAKHKAIDHLRRKREEVDVADVEESDVLRISSQLASRATLRSVMDGLPDRYLQAVVLRDVEQLPYEQVARRLDLNLNTVKSHVARGRALLAAKLAERRAAS